MFLYPLDTCIGADHHRGIENVLNLLIIAALMLVSSVFAFASLFDAIMHAPEVMTAVRMIAMNTMIPVCGECSLLAGFKWEPAFILSALLAFAGSGGIGHCVVVRYEKTSGFAVAFPLVSFPLPGISVPIAHEIAIRVDFINQMGCGEAVH